MSKVLAINKKARHDYEILESIEAGIELKGFEVKTIKTRGVSLKGVYATIMAGEAWLLNVDIPAYQPQNAPEEYDSKRSRKLLLNRKQIGYLSGRVQEKGLTIVPVKIYTKEGKIKVELALGKAKKETDKREEKKRRDIERDVERYMKDR